MKKIVGLHAILAVTLLTTGCANLNSIHRHLNTSAGEGALIDIKQRAIVTQHLVNEKKKEDGSTMRVTKYGICAEPSPDALSAYASEFASKVNLSGKDAAEFINTIREGSAFTGMRTHSIQLLRDSMYRICEAYINGAIAKEQYDLLMRRHQKYMVALMAIEQLTEIARVPAVTISTEGLADISRSVQELAKDISDIDEKISDLEKTEK